MRQGEIIRYPAPLQALKPSPAENPPGADHAWRVDVNDAALIAPRAPVLAKFGSKAYLAVANWKVSASSAILAPNPFLLGTVEGFLPGCSVSTSPGGGLTAGA